MVKIIQKDVTVPKINGVSEIMKLNQEDYKKSLSKKNPFYYAFVDFFNFQISDKNGLMKSLERDEINFFVVSETIETLTNIIHMLEVQRESYSNVDDKKYNQIVSMLKELRRLLDSLFKEIFSTNYGSKNVKKIMEQRINSWQSGNSGLNDNNKINDVIIEIKKLLGIVPRLLN